MAIDFPYIPFDDVVNPHSLKDNPKERLIYFLDLKKHYKLHSYHSDAAKCDIEIEFLRGYIEVNKSPASEVVEDKPQEPEKPPFKLTDVNIIKHKALTAIEALYFPTTVNSFKNEMNDLILNHDNPVKGPRLHENYRDVIKIDFPNEVGKLIMEGFPVPINEYFEELIPLYERIKALLYKPIEGSNAPHNEIYGVLRQDFLRSAELYISIYKNGNEPLSNFPTTPPQPEKQTQVKVDVPNEIRTEKQFKRPIFIHPHDYDIDLIKALQSAEKKVEYHVKDVPLKEAFLNLIRMLPQLYTDPNGGTYQAFSEHGLPFIYRHHPQESNFWETLAALYLLSCDTLQVEHFLDYQKTIYKGRQNFVDLVKGKLYNILVDYNKVLKCKNVAVIKLAVMLWVKEQKKGQIHIPVQPQSALPISLNTQQSLKNNIVPVIGEIKNYATLTELERDENLKWEDIPLKLVIAHFKVMTLKKSKNCNLFLTDEVLLKFIHRAFLNELDLPKQTINLSPTEKGFVIKRFYEFYEFAVSKYSAPNRKDKYIKVLSDNFINWDYASITSFFKPNKTKKKW